MLTVPLALSLLLLLAACQPKTRLEISSDAKPVSVTLPNGTNTDHVPIEVSETGARFPVSINGHPSRPFLFDSGSGVNAISVSLAEELGLHLLDETAETLIGQVKSKDLLYYAETVQIGKTQFHHVTFRAHSPGTPVINETKALIGFLLFAQTPFTIDFGKRELVLHPEPPTKVKRWSNFELLDAGIPVVPLTLKHPDTEESILDIPALIDTGAKSDGAPMIMMPRNIPPTHPELAPLFKGEGKPVTMKTALTKSAFTYYEATLEIEFGTYVGEGAVILMFEEKDNATFTFENRAIIGYSLFHDTAITFDIPNTRWHIKPSGQRERPSEK